MQLVMDDPVNSSIWSKSIELQRIIAQSQMQPLQTGAQQAMPKTCDERFFSSDSPLPWVPDVVGNRFGGDPLSVLIVASSYNGFIEGYSARNAVMPLGDYVRARDAGPEGLQHFIGTFKQCVVDRDDDYYQPIIRDLLPASGLGFETCCLTDLCKASFVQRGSGPEAGTRGDKGDDSVVRTNWQQWLAYVAQANGSDQGVPLPYEWLWRRMQQCRVILALGTIAEYGALKIFMRMASKPTAWSSHDGSVIPDHRGMTANLSDWGYAYASSRRKLGNWLEATDWWVLSDISTARRWFMLPVHHPASAYGRGADRGYVRTTARFRALIGAVT